MRNRYGDRGDERAREERLQDEARRFGARDGEGGTFRSRPWTDPEVFAREDASPGYDPRFAPAGRDEARYEGSGVHGWRESAQAFAPSRFEGPRYERDEGFDRASDDARFARDVGRFDRAASTRRPPSFVDEAYRSFEDRRFAGYGERGFEDQAIDRRDAHHRFAGPARGYASRPEASTHPSPYTPHQGPLARGGFAPAVPRPHAGKGPRGYVRSDERIREEVCDCLADGWVDASGVEVDVKDGVVMLAGQVPDKQSKRDIEDIAEACRGVRGVDNRIRVQRVVSKDEGNAGYGEAAARRGPRDKSVS